MEAPISPRVKKLKSPVVDPLNLNTKNSVTCENVPEELFDAATAKKHFSKFGKVQRIRLFPKRLMCMIEYDAPTSAEKAVLNAGAFDGFMFEVSRTKPKVRRRSKKEEDPDWVPDSDIEEELSAMSGGPAYRIPRQKAMEQDKPKPVLKVRKQLPMKKTPPKASAPMKQVSKPPAPSVIESPVAVVNTQTSMSTLEAATELAQLSTRTCHTPDEQWRALDARDRIIRSWGGAGSRVKVGGATIGTCRDMCPEKERLHRQAEHQVMTLECYPGRPGSLCPQRAVKQYSRSSADQEVPMCYELRPPRVLAYTCRYLLTHVADNNTIPLADWFHFLWDRFRSIRKDITQQALCCAESITLVEQCARFHAHSAARLADLEHTQFDQKLNTDNLTKCLQTLKHMYADVDQANKPCEAEFRGYIALLNLGDSNFWWEIKQLPLEIQKSPSIIFAIKVFNALDNNNYVKFFRLVRNEATYLQACILLRYFNDVRARALARIVKAFAPRGGSKYPAQYLMDDLAFESFETMQSFINHYGLRLGVVDDTEESVILDRNQFIEDSDPYPISRSIKLIESKRTCTVGEVIAGGTLLQDDFESYEIYSSFTSQGRIRLEALIAEDQGFNTHNDTNKDLRSLKTELKRILHGGKPAEVKQSLFVKPDINNLSSIPPKSNSSVSNDVFKPNFAFTPAIPVASTDIIKKSPDKVFETKNIFSFSKPQETEGAKSLKSGIENREPTNSKFNELGKSTFGKSVFGQTDARSLLDKNKKIPSNVFSTPNDSTNIFSKKSDGNLNEPDKLNPGGNLFAKQNNNNYNVFSKPNSNPFDQGSSIFGKSNDATADPKSIFGSVKSNAFSDKTNVFSQAINSDGDGKLKHTAITTNGETILSPKTLFKGASQGDENKSNMYSIFQSKNNGTDALASSIFSSVAKSNNDVYDFNEQEERREKERLQLEEEKRKQEEIRKHEEKVKELKRLEEEKRLELVKKQEEQRKQEEKRRKEEERKQQELKRKLEEEKRAKEEKERREEEIRRFKERVDTEANELVEELAKEVNREIVVQLLKEELEIFNDVLSCSEATTEQILADTCLEICISEMKAEKYLTERIMRKWFTVWKKQLVRNVRRRSLLNDTPVWLPEHSPLEKASLLRRYVEKSALKNMNDFHKGYKFSGQPNISPPPPPYNLMEIIKSPLLKRMKQISYPYDKCFFWKLSIISPGAMKYFYRRIDTEQWIKDVFSDNDKHETSDTLIHVGKQSWNNLMDFAISVSLTNPNNGSTIGEAIEGCNGLLFYVIESKSVIEHIETIMKHKYPKQTVPIALILPELVNEISLCDLEHYLRGLIQTGIISNFKLFIVDSKHVHDSLNVSTKSALRWLAKNYPPTPPLEIDQLKSLCQRYLGNEIWYKLKVERDSNIQSVTKDLCKLVDLYNKAVDRLISVLTDEDLFNYPNFPLEFRKYLNETSPFPKPSEYIPCNVKTSENASAIKDLLTQLKLPTPQIDFKALTAHNMQENMKNYCGQIGWFENPDQVACKVISVLPEEMCDETIPQEEFSRHLQHYDLLDLLNIIIYEKINYLKNFENRFAIYKPEVLEEYRNGYWLYEIDFVAKTKHKALENGDGLDYVISAKRRKLEDSIHCLAIEDKDATMVEEKMHKTNEQILEYTSCTDAVKQLERQLEEERKKSVQLENLLKAALSDVDIIF